MNYAVQVVLVGLLTQAAGAAILALLFARFHKAHGRPYLRAWSLGWWAICLAQLGASYGLAMQAEQPAAHPARLVATAISLVGAYWQAALLAIGAREVTSGHAVSGATRGRWLALLAVFGLGSAMLFAFEPEAVAERLFVRIAVRALVLGAAFLIAGATLWRVHRKSRDTGPRLVAAVFLALGVYHLHIVVLTRLGAPVAWALAAVFAELLLLGLLGLALVVWLLEQEHHRLSEASRQIEQLALHDLVTGLPNRKAFLDRLRQYLERNVGGREFAAVLFVDLDQFKTVNDTHGHDVGDLLLAAVGERLRRSVREGDTVGRLGGDEFTLLLPGVRSPADAREVARQLLAKLAAPVQVEDLSFRVGASVGISLFPQDGEEALTLLRNADAAMYQAKERGRGNVATFSQELSARLAERIALENELRVGIESDQLELHYQPIVRAGSGEIVGVEALVRWRHPSRGLLAPRDFLPLAEASGSSEAISEWVLNRACRVVAGWRSAHLPRLCLSVNLTARAFENPLLAEMVERALAGAGLAPDGLELEITETMALMHAGSHLSTLQLLRDRGVQVAVDDFGTGYSSLSYLRELPIDSLKLDSSFLRQLGRRPEDSRIVGAVIALAHGLGIEVVAEGVEEEEQMVVLELLSCDRMQGYLFSRPLSEADFARLIGSEAPFRSAPTPSRARRV